MDFQQAGYLDVMEALLKAGANPNQANTEQPFSMGYSGCGNPNCGLTSLARITPFWRAAHGADVAAMRLLVKYGADPKIARVAAPAGGRGGGGGGGGGAGAAGRGAGAAGAAGAAGGAGAAGAGAAGGAGAAAAGAGRGGAGGFGGGAGAGGGAGRGGAGGAPAANPAANIAIINSPAAQAAAALGATLGGAGGGAGQAANLSIPIGPTTAIHAASGLGFGQGVGAGNTNRFMPNGWLPSVKYLVEELGFDVNARDEQGFTPLHFAAARGDNDLILWLVEKGADVTAVSRNGFTTADMANGPQARITPMPATVALLESLGSKNSHRCASC
jgi:hypothetical protein